MNKLSIRKGLVYYRIKVMVGVVLLFGAIMTGNAQKIIDLKDYGIKPNSFENASQALVYALADAKGHDSVVIRFPGGRLDLWPQGAEQREYYVSNSTESDSLPKLKTIGLLLDQMQNVTLEGNGTLLMAHGKMVHLALDNCKNIKVNGLQFDYERPTMSEMKVLDKDKSTVTVQVHKDSRFWIDDGKINWFGEGWKAQADRTNLIYYRPSLETMYYGTYQPFDTAEVVEVATNKLRFNGDFSSAKFKIGDVLTFRDVYRDCLGILNHYSEDVALNDIQMHYMHGMGVVSQFSKNIYVDNFEGKPRAASDRTITAFADFLHFSGCYGKITVQNSLFSGSHDDGINVHGTHLRVVARDGNTIKVRFMHHQTWNLMAFEAGDNIGFVDNTNLLVYAEAKVEKVARLSERELELQLDRPAPKGMKDKHCVENRTKTPEVLIHNNRFEHTNTRGVLLTTRKKAIIENNTFFRTGMHAILIADDCNFWYESGPVKDVTIRNNKFVECGYNSLPNTFAIAIMPETHTFMKNNYVHSNITIENNEFTLFAPPLLFARSTENLSFSGNTIKGKKSTDFPSSDKPMFFLEHCNEVLISGNTYSDTFPSREIHLSKMVKEQLRYGPKKEFQLILNRL